MHPNRSISIEHFVLKMRDLCRRYSPLGPVQPPPAGDLLPWASAGAGLEPPPSDPDVLLPLPLDPLTEPETCCWRPDADQDEQDGESLLMPLDQVLLVELQEDLGLRVCQQQADGCAGISTPEASSVRIERICLSRLAGCRSVTRPPWVCRAPWLGDRSRCCPTVPRAATVSPLAMHKRGASACIGKPVLCPPPLALQPPCKRPKLQTEATVQAQEEQVGLGLLHRPRELTDPKVCILCGCTDEWAIGRRPYSASVPKAPRKPLSDANNEPEPPMPETPEHGGAAPLPFASFHLAQLLSPASPGAGTSAISYSQRSVVASTSVLPSAYFHLGLSDREMECLQVLYANRA